MADLTDIGCCSCFSFLRKSNVPVHQSRDADGMFSEDLLDHQSVEDPDGSIYTGDDPFLSFYNGDDLDRSFLNGDDPDRSFLNGDDPYRSFYDRDDNDNLDGSDDVPPTKSSEDIIKSRAQNGFACREIPVKETNKVFSLGGRKHWGLMPVPDMPRAVPSFWNDVNFSLPFTPRVEILNVDEDGNKMVNQYVHLGKIGSGSYGKVKHKRWELYAVKVLNKPYMMKIRVVCSETAMKDVLREVSITKMLNHPNIVNLVEVINDSNTDKFYMVLEYVEGKMVCDNGLEEATARNYLRDIIYGLMYLHSHNVIHGDIKPDNLLVTSSGNLKIGDFSVSQVFEDDDDMLWRSPGTPVFIALECCQGTSVQLPIFTDAGSAYHGRASDTWAVGVTLYCMISGHYPFLGDTLQETYDKIANDPVQIPGDMNTQLADLLQRLLCKDPGNRITLQAAAEHPWVVGDKGPVPEYICRCGFGRREKK